MYDFSQQFSRTCLVVVLRTNFIRVRGLGLEDFRKRVRENPEEQRSYYKYSKKNDAPGTSLPDSGSGVTVVLLIEYAVSTIHCRVESVYRSWPRHIHSCS
jgi:hypothetical protein